MTIDLERLALDADYWDEVAPEGATHFMYSEKFVKWVDGVEWEFYAFSDRVWKEAFCNWSLQDYINRGDGCVTAKPAAPKSHPTDTQPTESGAQISAEWDGKIPPVGWHGECTWASKVFFPQCVILPNGKVVIEFYGLWEFRNISELDQIMFRPILSREQRDREEIINAAAKVVEVKFGSPRSVYIAYCEALYDAGMLRMPDEDFANKARGES
jgi:hypothetical protein